MAVVRVIIMTWSTQNAVTRTPARARGPKIDVTATHSFRHIIISYINDSYTVVRGTCENSDKYSEYFTLIGDFRFGCFVERDVLSQN